VSPRRKARWDPQPTQKAEVLLASDGTRGFTKGAVAKAAALADSGPVAVVTIARIYGTSLGLPHPGLLPNKQEMEERVGWVNDAISRLQRAGAQADGQVASTRRAARAISRIARARKVRIVVIDDSPTHGVRRALEGSIGRKVIRALRGSGVDVEVVPFTETRSKTSWRRGPVARR
jgi:hypothetical protein